MTNLIIYPAVEKFANVVVNGIFPRYSTSSNAYHIRFRNFHIEKKRSGEFFDELIQF